jgi:hypothetical protein
MNEVEVERQIDQMVRFIKQEAEEKANEIAVSAEEVRPTLRQSVCTPCATPCAGRYREHQTERADPWAATASVHARAERT